MAVSVTRVGNPTSFGDKKVGIFDLVFSGNYPDEGEPVTPADFDYPNDIEFVILSSAAAADGETALVAVYDYAADTVLFYESAATGLALLEKTASEAYPTNTTVRALVIGH